MISLRRLKAAPATGKQLAVAWKTSKRKEQLVGKSTYGEAFTEGSGGPVLLEMEPGGKPGWQTAWSQEPQLAVLCRGQDSRGLMSGCVIQWPLTMQVREEKLAFVQCLHYAMHHKRVALPPEKSPNLTCEQHQCVSSCWSSAAWQVSTFGHHCLYVGLRYFLKCTYLFA